MTGSVNRTKVSGSSKEILDLRVQGSLNALKQLDIDLARVQGIRDGEASGVVKVIQERSQELSTYIDDFNEGLREL